MRTLFLCLLSGLLACSAWGGTVRVTASFSQLRAEPIATASPVALVYGNDLLTILKRGRRWHQVRTAEGATGWVTARAVKGWELTPPQPASPKLSRSNGLAGTATRMEGSVPPASGIDAKTPVHDPTLGTPAISTAPGGIGDKAVAKRHKRKSFKRHRNQAVTENQAKNQLKNPAETPAFLDAVRLQRLGHRDQAGEAFLKIIQNPSNDLEYYESVRRMLRYDPLGELEQSAEGKVNSESMARARRYGFILLAKKWERLVSQTE